MKINHRIGLEFLNGRGGRCYSVHTLKLWALNHELSEKEIWQMCEMAGFWGSKRILRRWKEKPEDFDCNNFYFVEVENEEDSSD